MPPAEHIYPETYQAFLWKLHISHFMPPLLMVELASKRKKIPGCIKFLLCQCNGSFCPLVTAHHENAIQRVTQPRGDNRGMNCMNYHFYGALNLHSQKGTTGVFQEFIPWKDAQPFHIYGVFSWKIYSVENPILHTWKRRDKKTFCYSNTYVL